MEELRHRTSLEILPISDPRLLRRADVRKIRGSYEKLAEVTQWRPEISFSTTVRDTLDSWRDRLADGAQ